MRMEEFASILPKRSHRPQRDSAVTCALFFMDPTHHKSGHLRFDYITRAPRMTCPDVRFGYARKLLIFLYGRKYTLIAYRWPSSTWATSAGFGLLSP